MKNILHFLNKKLEKKKNYDVIVRNMCYNNKKTSYAKLILRDNLVLYCFKLVNNSHKLIFIKHIKRE